MAYLLFTILFTWFRLGSLEFSTGFPEIVFSSPISFHIFGIDPGWSFRLYPGIHIGRPKQRSLSGSNRSQNHQQNIAHFPVYYGTTVQRDSGIKISNITATMHNIFFPAFFNSTSPITDWQKKRQETCDLVNLIYNAKVFVTSTTSLGPCLLLRGRNMAD